jgi:hypothetical protein
MNPQKRRARRPDVARIPNPCQRKALRLLNEAWLAAREEGQDVWQFAVEIHHLLNLGLSYTDLRCLLRWDYLEHARERTTARSRQRIFQPHKTLALSKRTCFVLTAKGREIISKCLGETAEGLDATTAGPTASLPYVPEVPRWDREARRLWWKNHLVKEFHRPADNQELVLAALQEQGWPPQIDDPLPKTRDIDPKVRLHDTIKALNRHQRYPILHFGSAGNGRAIRWSLRKRGRTKRP